MELKSFIGQVVISTYTKRRFRISKITGALVGVVTEKPGASGYPAHYVYKTINGDPVSNGDLVFEDPALTEPFKKAYEAYSRTEEARWENYEYWMRAD